MVTGSSKILLEFILEIVCVCRTDGQTDERTSKTRNAAYWDGRIIMTASAEVKRRRRLCFGVSRHCQLDYSKITNGFCLHFVEGARK